MIFRAGTVRVWLNLAFDVAVLLCGALPRRDVKLGSYIQKISIVMKQCVSANKHGKLVFQKLQVGIFPSFRHLSRKATCVKRIILAATKHQLHVLDSKGDLAVFQFYEFGKNR